MLAANNPLLQVEKAKGMSSSFPFIFNGAADGEEACLSLDQLQEAMLWLCEQIEAIELNPVLPDGTFLLTTGGVLTGCLTLPPGCVGDDNAVQWGELRQVMPQFKHHRAQQVVTDLNGEAVVPFGSTFANVPTVVLTPSEGTNSQNIGTWDAVIVSTTTSNFRVRIYDNSGNIVTSKTVTFNWQAMGDY